MELNETSLGRVWSHFSNPEKSVAILTAFRGEHTYEENVNRNGGLAASIRNLGYGFIYLDGYWVENKGTDKEIHVKEDSILVNAPASDQNFIQAIHGLANSYDQDACLVKDSGGVRLIFSDGSEQQLGGIKPGKLAQAYSKLRTNKKTNTFVFEAERDDRGFLDRLSVLAGIKSNKV